MPKTKTTRKPCPGCGEAKWGREPEKLCDSCAELLADAKRIADNADRTDRILIAIPETLHALPHVTDGARFSDPPQPLDDIQAAVAQLLESSAEEIPATTAGELKQLPQFKNVRCIARGLTLRLPTDLRGELRNYNESIYKLEWSSGWDCRFFLAKPGVADALDSIYRAFAESALLRYIEGKRSGADFIKRLATGDAGIGDYNELVAPSRRGQRGKRIAP